MALSDRGGVTTATKVGIQNASYTYAADAEASDAYAIALDPPVTAYAAGQNFIFKANTLNTGAATLNVNGLGAKAIKKSQGDALVTGDIEASQVVEVVYDGTNFQMMSPSAAAVGATTTEALSVANIDDPSTELNAIAGSAKGETRLCYQTIAGKDEWTWYAWDDADSGAESVPYTVDGSSGIWTAVAGRYANGAQGMNGVLTATSAALTTPAIGAATGTSVVLSAATSQIPIYTETLTGTDTLVAAECYGAVYSINGTGTVTLPPVAAGMSLTIITHGAIAVHVKPDANDLLFLDGVTLDDGDKASNLSTSGDIIVLSYLDATGWNAVTNSWTDGGA